MKSDRIKLTHILEASEEIAVMLEDGLRDRKTELAITRLIEIIGEAAKHVSQKLRDQYPEIPWSNIIGMRNILVHEYFRVDRETIWDVAEHKIPTIRSWVQGILEAAEE